jgi:hypothetical protein
MPSNRGKEEMMNTATPNEATQSEEKNDALTTQEIITHLENEGVEWQKLENFLHDLEQSCVDGRDNEPVIGLPGGDMGALILKIVVAEEMRRLQNSSTESNFAKDQIKEIYRKYIAKFGKFYFHSDEHAVKDLGKALTAKYLDQANNPFPAVDLTNVKAVEALIRNPKNDEQKQALLEQLIKHLGCGHIRLMLENPDQYGIRPEIVEALIEAFFEDMWENGESALDDYVVLPGDHAEKLVLVVNVENPEELTADSLVPAVRPLNPENTQDDVEDEFFIYHPQVVAAILRLVADIMIEDDGDEIIPGINKENIKEFIIKIQALGEKQLGATLGHLAEGKEIWQTTVSMDKDKKTVVSHLKKVAKVTKVKSN